MAPPTTTTARLTRGEAGRCARPLSLEPLKLEDGDHTGVEESPAEQRHPSSSTTTFARPPAAAPLVVDDHLGSAASRAAAPLIVDDHLASAASRAAAPPHRRQPFHLGHRRGDGTIVAGTAHPSPALQAQYRPTTTGVVETPKCSSATRPALHVQARHRPDAAITAKTPKCSPTTRSTTPVPPSPPGQNSYHRRFWGRWI